MDSNNFNTPSENDDTVTVANSKNVDSSGKTDIVKSPFQSPTFKPVSNFKRCRVQSSESSDYDIPSYQVNQSVGCRTASKCESDSNDIFVPFSPVFSPVTVPVQIFRPPSIHSLGTIVKRSKSESAAAGRDVKKVTECGVDSSSVKETKECESVFDKLQMTDKDASWASYMATPAPAELPVSEFNTVERATFLPEEKFQTMQPRALFSPASDDNFGFSPLPNSSDSDGESYKASERLSDVCATLRQLEFKSLDEMLKSPDRIGKTVSSLTDNDYPQSPVFVIKPKRAKRKDIVVRSPEFSSQNSDSKNPVMESKENVDVTSSSHPVGKSEESFMDLSFSEIDRMCDTLLNAKTESETITESQRLIELFLGKKDSPPLNAVTLNTENCSENKFSYKSEGSTETELTGHYFSSYHEIHNMTSKQRDMNVQLKRKTNRAQINRHFWNKFKTLIQSKSKQFQSKLMAKIFEASGKTVAKNDGEKLSHLDMINRYLSDCELTLNKEEIMHIVELLEEEEIMLAAVEEAEKTLAEEAEMMRAVDQMENTTIPDPREGTKGFDYSFAVGKFTLPENEDSGIDKKSFHRSSGDFQNMTSGSELPSDLCANIGFSTASGAKMTISEKAMCKAKDFLAKCEKDDRVGEVEVIRNVDDPSGSDKQNTSSKVKNIPDEPGDYSFGFQTCLGKKVEVTKEALSRAKSLFSDCDDGIKDEGKGEPFLNESPVELVNPVPSTSKGLHERPDGSRATGSDRQARRDLVRREESLKGNDIVNCESTDQNVEMVLSRESPGPYDKGPPAQTSFGFSTASGLKVSVSKTALNKAREFMAKCGEDGDTVDTDLTGCGPSRELESSARFEVSSKSASVVEPPKSFEMGFKTCLGKKVDVTGEALAKARTLFSDCDENMEETFVGTRKDGKGPRRHLQNVSKTEGTTTAGSESDSLDNSRLKRRNNTEAEMGGGRFEIGFKTCLGKKVEVMGEALEKARLLMASCDQSSNLDSSIQNEVKLPSPKSRVVGECSTPDERNSTIRSRYRGSADIAKRKSCLPRCSTPLANITPRPCKLLPDEGDLTGTDLDKTIRASFSHSLSSTIPGSVHALTPTDETTLFGDSDQTMVKIKKRKLHFEAERDATALREGTIEEISTRERSSLKRPLEDATSQCKRLKMGSDDVDDDAEMTDDCDGIKEKRMLQRSNQETVIRDKRKVVPAMGSHLARKTKEEQKSFAEAVGSFISRDYYKTGYISVVDAANYRFSSPHWKRTVCLSLDDGFQVIPDDEDKVGREELKRSFLAGPGVQPSLVPEGWLDNHIKWIVWKLSHYERAFSGGFRDRALTPNNVMLQLKYRYDREIDRSERSALRKILEKDDTSIKRIVLCVCGIKKVQTGDTSGYELNLTDGWYSCPARTDPAMVRLIERGKILEGMKLVTQGAVLVNCDQGISPLEMSEDVHLKIFTNSTRRIRWDAKLGFQKNPGSLTVSLNSVLPEGGPISRVDVIVVRVYPFLYLEKMADGRRIVRNARAEEKADSAYKKLLEERMESIYNSVRSEIRSTSGKGSNDILSPDTDQDFGRNSIACSSPSSHFRRQDRIKMEISKKVEDRLKRDNLNKRNVTELLRVKVVDLRRRNFDRPAVLSVWNPNEEIAGMFAEGKAISLMNATTGSFPRGNNFMQINASRQTRYHLIPGKWEYPARCVTPLEVVSSLTSAVFEEVELVGVVILIKDVSSSSSGVSQIVYLADAEFHFVGLSFWGTCQEYGWDRVLRRSSVVACSNLHLKSARRIGDVPLVHVKETSAFTENPRSQHLKEGVEKLKRQLPKDIGNYLAECEETLRRKLEAPPSSSLSSSRRDVTVEGSVLKDIDVVAAGKELQSRVADGSSDGSLLTETSFKETSASKLVDSKSKGGGKSSSSSSNSSFRWLPYVKI